MTAHETALIVVEARLERLRDGSVWGNAAFAPAAWQRHLDVFPGLLVAARVSRVSAPSPGSVRVDVPGVIDVVELPDYVGLSGLIREMPRVRTLLRRAASSAGTVILRVPTTSGVVLAPGLWRSRRPYVVEVVGDPEEVFSEGVVDHPLRPLVQRAAVGITRSLCARASGAVYVTRHRLQDKYPPAVWAPAVSSSDVLLDDVSFHEPLRRSRAVPTVVTIGSMDQTYKGIDVVLDACALLRRRGVTALLEVVGEGRHRAALETQARSLGLGDSAQFHGQLDRDAVRDTLRSADLFVLASRTEGLPRAMLEAMAAGLPCVGTCVGGIPELLAPSDLVPPDDAESLAGAMAGYLVDAEKRYAAGARNQTAARDWAVAAGSDGRRQVYERAKSQSARWWQEASDLPGS